jgi:hypothetical protein
MIMGINRNTLRKNRDLAIQSVPRRSIRGCGTILELLLIGTTTKMKYSALARMFSASVKYRQSGRAVAAAHTAASDKADKLNA